SRPALGHRLRPRKLSQAIAATAMVQDLLAAGRGQRRTDVPARAGSARQRRRPDRAAATRDQRYTVRSARRVAGPAAKSGPRRTAWAGQRRSVPIGSRRSASTQEIIALSGNERSE